MFKSAFGYDEGTIFYFDLLGNKYVAQGGLKCFYEPLVLQYLWGLALASVKEDLKKEKNSPFWIWIATVLYTISFPFFLYASLFSVAILNPTGIKLIQYAFILTCLAIPLSIPCSIFFMWRGYYQENTSKMNFFCWAPVITGFISYYLIELLGLFM